MRWEVTRLVMPAITHMNQEPGCHLRLHMIWRDELIVSLVTLHMSL
jgi:hypothetical protein